MLAIERKKLEQEFNAKVDKILEWTDFISHPENKEQEKIAKENSLKRAAYKRACSEEKLMFLKIIRDATEYLEIQENYKGIGRPPVYLRDMLKTICIKAYHNYSGARTESELRIAKAMGVIDEIYKPNTILRYMQNPEIIKLLENLYKLISEPISSIEEYFAIDATGISNQYGNQRWVNIRNSKCEKEDWKKYTKLHIISGCKTNIICSAKITTGNKHESPFLKEMLDETNEYFTPKKVLADAGYLSRDNVKYIKELGAEPYIWVKNNINIPQKGRLSAWGEMLNLWKYNKTEFAMHYHKRSNVESTFSALKRKYGDLCRSRKIESQTSEILAKIVCFNANILAMSVRLYNLDLVFKE